MIVALRSLLVCLPILCLNGCSWVPYLARNLVGTSCEVLETSCFRHDIAKLANQAWADVVAENPECKHSPAFMAGFKDGFKDYVTRNGLGEPPAIPPHCYRYPVLRTPEQQQQIEDWYAGFRRGSQTAHQEQLRTGVLIPISQPSINRPTHFRQEIIATPSMAPPVAKPEELPEPKPPPIKPPPEMLPAKDAVRLEAPVPQMRNADDVGSDPAGRSYASADREQVLTLTGGR
jgi:hypothetical protein